MLLDILVFMFIFHYFLRRFISTHLLFGILRKFHLFSYPSRYLRFIFWVLPFLCMQLLGNLACLSDVSSTCTPQRQQNGECTWPSCAKEIISYFLLTICSKSFRGIFMKESFSLKNCVNYMSSLIHLAMVRWSTVLTRSIIFGWN